MESEGRLTTALRTRHSLRVEPRDEGDATRRRQIVGRLLWDEGTGALRPRRSSSPAWRIVSILISLFVLFVLIARGVWLVIHLLDGDFLLAAYDAVIVVLFAGVLALRVRNRRYRWPARPRPRPPSRDVPGDVD